MKGYAWAVLQNQCTFKASIKFQIYLYLKITLKINLTKRGFFMQIYKNLLEKRLNINVY